MARCVWALLDEDIIEHMLMNENNNAKQWIFSMMESLDHKNFTTVIISLWAIWTARRKAIHEGIFQSPISTYDFIQRFLSELEDSKPAIPKKQGSAARSCKPKWIRPPSGMVKINVDGAVARNGDHGSASAICRDDQGRFLGALARTIKGISDPATLEAFACVEALTLAQDLGLSKMVVSSDCLEVINMLNAKNSCSYSSLLIEIDQRSKLFEEVQYQHEGRDSNGDAHMLARNAISQEFGRHALFIEPPDFVSSVIDI